MDESTDLTNCQRNREVMLNRAKDYYKNYKERLGEQTRNKKREYGKNKKREYGKNRYHNMSE